MRSELSGVIDRRLALLLRVRAVEADLEVGYSLELEHFGAPEGAAIILGLQPGDAVQAKDSLAGALAPEHLGIQLVADPTLQITQLLFIRDVVLGLGNLTHQ